jgi:putative transposase
MKTVCNLLGLARSHIHELKNRSPSWVDGRRQAEPEQDEQLVLEIREQIADLRSYGYRRACALVNRQRSKTGRPRVNHKRVYRVMAANILLLPKAPKRPCSSRRHEGVVSVPGSDQRWCSDGFEIKCDSGQTVTTTFTKDCCDREIMVYSAWEGKGLPGEPVREMLIEAVEKRFGAVESIPPDHKLEFLSDNGGAYIAADTRKIARSLGLTPINTPVCSPQSNGMADSFVNTFERDYVSKMDLTDARTVLAQLQVAFEHVNEVHPHSSLKMQSPREFRQNQTVKQRPESIKQPALHCD